MNAEFEHLKAIKGIARNPDLVAFVEKARLSLRAQEKFKRLDCHKRSLLHYAAMGNCTRLLSYLLESKPDVEPRDQWGRTPLSWAIEYCSLEVAKFYWSEELTSMHWITRVAHPWHGSRTLQTPVGEAGRTPRLTSKKWARRMSNWRVSS